jgi:hypothetical protein
MGETGRRIRPNKEQQPLEQGFANLSRAFDEPPLCGSPRKRDFAMGTQPSVRTIQTIAAFERRSKNLQRLRKSRKRRLGILQTLRK